MTQPNLDTLPLADLHRHLDGSLRPTTLLALAAGLGKPVPEDLLFHPGMGLDEALTRFAFTLSLLQQPEAVERVAAEICEDAEAEGVTTLEIRFAPQLHLGASPEQIVDAALSGISRRAGLLLCGLYGEPPAVLERLVEIGRTRPGVVGIDLAGGPTPGHHYGLADYAPSFARAAAVGLGRTVHAGEGRPAEEIRRAIEVLGAQRVGHATSLLDDCSVLELVLERDITIEACPTSNWHTGVIAAVTEHPLAQWLRSDVHVTVSPDNTLLSAVGARAEYLRTLEIPGMNPRLVEQLAQFGHRAAFRRG
jgi:adenosine deaminase